MPVKQSAEVFTGCIVCTVLVPPDLNPCLWPNLYFSYFAFAYLLSMYLYVRPGGPVQAPRSKSWSVSQLWPSPIVPPDRPQFGTHRHHPHPHHLLNHLMNHNLYWKDIGSQINCLVSSNLAFPCEWPWFVSGGWMGSPLRMGGGHIGWWLELPVGEGVLKKSQQGKKRQLRWNLIQIELL